MKTATFSTDELPGHLADRERYQIFRDLYVQNVGSVDIKAPAEGPFHARIAAMMFGGLTVGMFAGTIGSIVRTRHDLLVDGKDEYCLAINAGPALIGGHHRGREMALGRLSAGLISLAETGSLHAATHGTAPSHTSQHHEWINIVLPGDLLRRSTHRPDDMLGQTIRADNRRTGFLLRYVRHLFQEGPELAGLGLDDHISRTIVDLVTHVLDNEGDREAAPASHGLRAARLQAVTAAIRMRFSDPALTAQTIAPSIGMSVRSLHAVLHETGSSFSERVLELRLQMALSMLTDRGRHDRTVASVAMTCGFGDISYFNRAFRRRFGCTPSAAR